MKTKREDQAKQLAYSMCHWLRNNPEELQKRILHDLETMGDMQLAGVAKDLGVNFDDDKPDTNEPADPFAGDLNIRVKVIMSAYITIGVTAAEASDDNRLWNAVASVTSAYLRQQEVIDSMDTVIDGFELEDISDDNDEVIQAPVPESILQAFRNVGDS